MRVYIGFDDTDTIDGEYGTGKVVRKFGDTLPEGCRLWGVVRQQLLVDERIPYTSHNSSACAVIDADDASLKDDLLEKAVQHLSRWSVQGSDPGLCIACEGDNGLSGLMDFGKACTSRVVTQAEAMKAASHAHLSGHGGTNDGIIGAAAAVGLTAWGWSGRFIEFGDLRSLSEKIRVTDLLLNTILVVSMDRDSRLPAPGDLVHTKRWLRPRLWGHQAVLPVMPAEEGHWECMGGKRNGHTKSREG